MIALIIGTHEVTEADYETIRDADAVITMIGGEAKLQKLRWDDPGEHEVKIIDKQKHMLVVHGEHWAIEHPIQCKGETKTLSECPLQVAVVNYMKDQGGPPLPVGRYRIELRTSGVGPSDRPHIWDSDSETWKPLP